MGGSRHLDEELYFRRREIMALHRRWAFTCKRVLRSGNPRYADMSWQEYSLSDVGPNYNQKSLSESMSKMRQLEGMNNGFALDFSAMRESRDLWYKEREPYKEDCALLLCKLLNNMRWCRQEGNSELMREELGFPLVNYEMGYGPTFPVPGTVFGKRDAQAVLQCSKGLVYFEPEHTGWELGCFMKVEKF